MKGYKRILLALAIPLGATSCTSFSEKDTLFHTINAIDTYQTIRIGKCSSMVETNPITKAFLGSDPKPAETIGLFLATSVIYQKLRDKTEGSPVKTFLLDLFLLGKAGTVVGNKIQFNRNPKC